MSVAAEQETLMAVCGRTTAEAREAAGVELRAPLNVHTETATSLLHSGASGSLTTDEDNE
jgi:hypothetical protein